mmetsp:Transcript_68861/g.165288  ORF Transcript_68861/g.165288 Transcript_68861/m.165288 type:complete len:230 (-) Transcript_68861:980-1669(-)
MQVSVRLELCLVLILHAQERSCISSCVSNDDAGVEHGPFSGHAADSRELEGPDVLIQDLHSFGAGFKQPWSRVDVFELEARDALQQPLNLSRRSYKRFECEDDGLQSAVVLERSELLKMLFPHVWHCPICIRLPHELLRPVQASFPLQVGRQVRVIRRRRTERFTLKEAFGKLRVDIVAPVDWKGCHRLYELLVMCSAQTFDVNRDVIILLGRAEDSKILQIPPRHLEL